MTNAEARCNKSLRPRKPEGSLGRTAQDVHLDTHTAPELCEKQVVCHVYIYTKYTPRQSCCTTLNTKRPKYPSCTSKLLYVFERKTSTISVLLYKAVVRLSTRNVPNISLADKADVRLCHKEAPQKKKKKKKKIVCVFQHKTSKISV